MIVDPDFMDHWRTRMLVDELGGDEMAPLYILRIWSHCQNRRATRFELPAAGVKAICRYTGDAARFEDALIATGFISREGVCIEVPKWAIHNASLIAAWSNGRRGGRPRNEEEEPNENPRVTHGEPTPVLANPRKSEERGVEKIREEKNKNKSREGEGFCGAGDGPGTTDGHAPPPQAQNISPSKTAEELADVWLAEYRSSSPAKKSRREIAIDIESFLMAGCESSVIEAELRRTTRSRADPWGFTRTDLSQLHNRNRKTPKKSTRAKIEEAMNRS